MIILEEKKLASSIAQLAKNLKSFHEGISKTLSEVFTPEVIQGMKEYPSDFNKFKTILIEIGYPPFWDLEIYDIRKTVKIYESHGQDGAREFLDELFITYCDKKFFNNILIKWNTRRFLNHRINMLEEIITCHNSKLYSCAIPTCVAQIEGVIVETNKHVGWLRQAELITYIEKTLDDKEIYSFDDVINKVMDSIIYEKFIHGSEYSSPINRNAIMHGVDTKYGVKINSIKVLLILDYVIDSLNERLLINPGLTKHLNTLIN